MDGWNPAKAGATGTANFDVWATFTSGGSLITRQIQGDGIDQHLAFVTSSNAYWYLTDHLGSTRATINNSGTVQDSIVYDAYGNITSQSNASAAPLYTYTGRELDVETGLQYNRARWYDAGTGRWISQDPMGFDAGDSNLYRYVNNRPTVATDPSGLRRINIEIYYDKTQKTTLDGVVKDRIELILNSAVKSYAKDPNDVEFSVTFVATSSAAALKKVVPGFGQSVVPSPWYSQVVPSAGYLPAIILSPLPGSIYTGISDRTVRTRTVKNLNTVKIILDETLNFNAKADGQGAQFGMVIFPDNIRKDLDALGVAIGGGGQGENFKIALATTIVHELVCHALPGGKHSSEKGFADSTPAPWDADEISKEGALRLFATFQIPAK